MTEEKKIKKKIEDAQKELTAFYDKEKNSKRKDTIKKLEDYSTDEKVEWFNKMYNSAKSELVELETKGYSDEDNAIYAWEIYIEILAKNNIDFWAYWNSLIE